MADFRRKASDGDEFRRGLEVLVRGHIEGCMTSAAALAYCSPADEDEDGGGAAGVDGSDLLMRRRRRSDLEGVDLAETSAAARRHSRILSRWAARQAEEMITTIERRNRESELMALARLHTVSMLDASFLRETRRAAAQTTVERPVATSRASSVLQQWRELEEEASAAARNRRSPTPEPSSVTSDSFRRSHISETLHQQSSEVASESNYVEYVRSADGPSSSAIGQQDVEVDDSDEPPESSREQSPEAGENGDGERERVRQIVRGWMTETPIADTALRLSPTTESQGNEWLGERERGRVRLVREWVQLASEQRDVQTGLREEQGRERSVSSNEAGPPENARRDLLRLRGRQARLDLIMRIVRERERELQSLSEHRAVSCFAHRNRIQSFLRGRFLRIGRPTEDERRPSVAARELGQLRRHPVSVLREEFRFGQDSTIEGSASSHSGDFDNNDIDDFGNDASRSTRLQVSEDNSEQAADADISGTPLEMEVYSQVQSLTSMENDIDWNNSAAQQVDWQEEEIEDRERNLQQPTVIRFLGWHNGDQEEYLGSWQENINQNWRPRDTSGVEDGQTNHPLDEHSNWNEDDIQAAEANWEDDSSDQQSLPVRTVNRFIPPDDDNVYSMELRELLSRRSVSNLLHSGFRESLDQLIQSYVERQGRESFNWDLERTIPNTDLSDEGQGQDMQDVLQEQQNSVTRPQHVPPSPPIPPPQPLWHSEFRHSWTRQGIQRSEMELDAIDDLRADMARLQQVMSHMQSMLETCMDMQLELQRAVRQEVSAALNHSFGDQGEAEGSSGDGGKWAHVKKGICCICCDNQIDSLFYRCGHMCSCSKCATKFVQEKGKCPLCRAPIVEVIRAYFIM